MTEIMLMFRQLGHKLIFTVSYWAKSQPIEELVWAYVKNYVARKYYPGRTQLLVRHQIIRGMYGHTDRLGVIHNGLDSDLAPKYINHTHKYINEYVRSSPQLKHRGVVGSFI